MAVFVYANLGEGYIPSFPSKSGNGEHYVLAQKTLHQTESFGGSKKIGQ